MMNMSDTPLIDTDAGQPAGRLDMAGAGGVLRVLIVEDEAMIAMLLAEVLREMGHEVCAIAPTEDAAVAAAVRHRPNLIIVDEWLRHGSGMAAMAKINRSGHVAHVFVTGDPSIGRSLGPDMIAVQKPFTIPELVKAVQGALAKTDGGDPHPA
jgi:two-component system, response regulator PdtaR